MLTDNYNPSTIYSCFATFLWALDDNDDDDGGSYCLQWGDNGAGSLSLTSQTLSQSVGLSVRQPVGSESFTYMGSGIWPA